VALIRFRPGVPDDLFRSLKTVVRTAFARRRKTLRNASVAFFKGGAAEWCDLLEAAGIDPSSRAETVSPERYLRLAGLAGPRLSFEALPAGAKEEM
jgi:16S rRNA A1518/A1519 N6-dimethyltransferase RsmA/KsgA/DIM1 with predicted DNA glycosylase/AP lyase activity